MMLQQGHSSQHNVQLIKVSPQAAPTEAVTTGLMRK